MTPEEIQALVDAAVAGALAKHQSAAEKAAAAKDAADKAAADKAAKDAADKAAKDAADKAAKDAAAKNGLTPELNSRLLEMQRSLDEANNRVKASEDARTADQTRLIESERTAEVGRALNGYNFARDSARSLAEKELASKLTRTDDGKFVAPGNVTPAEFAKQYLAQESYLLAPHKAGGSGFQGGAPGTVNAPVDLNTPITSANRTQYTDAIRNALSGN